MPRLKPPPSQQVAEPDPIPPSEDIEIELAGDPPSDTEVDLASPPPKPAEPEPQPEPTLASQLAAQQHAEQLQRSNSDLARQLQERDAEIARQRDRGDDAEYNSVLTAIAAEQSLLDKAEADYAAYASAGDWGAAGKAQRIMASASARLDRLEDGKLAFDNKREAAKTAPPPQPSRSAPLDTEQKIAAIQGLPDNAKGWLRKHPEFVNDTPLNQKLGSFHNYLANNKGVLPFTDAYFDALDTEFGFKTPAAPEPSAQPQKRSMPVSAPVSRDVPTPSGQRQPSSKVTLSAEERQIARSAFTAVDMTNEQKERLYAQNKQKLARMRANGAYPQTTEQNG